MISVIFETFSGYRGVRTNAGIAFLTLLMALAGCTADSGEEVRSRLYGSWRSDAAIYRQAHQAVFEINQQEIVFRTVEGTLDIYYITSLEHTPSKEGENFHIEYRNSNGEEFFLDLLLSTTRTGDMITFANRERVRWRKNAVSLGLR